MADPDESGARRIARDTTSTITVAATWFGITATLWVAAIATSDRPLSVSRWFSSLAQFDGPEYLDIAENGYADRQLVWFPSYVGAIRLAGLVTDDLTVAAVSITLVASLAAAIGYWRWLEIHVDDLAARWTGFGVMALYPYSLFLYGTVYPTALYLALTIYAFVLVERDRLLLAGIVAAVATATRPSGFAAAIALWIVALERSGVLLPPDGHGWRAALRLPTVIDRSAWRPRLAAPLLAWSGLIAYTAYNLVDRGHPLRWLTEQENYHDGGTASLLKHQYFEAWYGGFDGRHLATTTAQALLLVAAIVSVPVVGRRFGWGYAVLVAGLALLPSISVSTFMGTGRYLVPAFPAFALFGEWLARRRIGRIVWLGASATCLVVMFCGFTRSWYLS